jgi:hypothetical protein
MKKESDIVSRGRNRRVKTRATTSTYSLGFLSGLTIGSSWKHAFSMDPSEDRVEHILRAHQRVPYNLQGHCRYRIEYTGNLPHSSSLGSSGHYPPDLVKPFEPATSFAILNEPRQVVPIWRGLLEPSRVLWIGRLPGYLSLDIRTFPEPTRLCR